ncbi:MAG: amino acid adenylation domain-containing protein, partial [Bacteroidota bacterium]
RTKMDGGWSFEELLGEVKGSCLSSFSHQMVPFEQVVERVVAERDRSRSPIFQVVFVLDNTPVSKAIAFDDLQFESEQSGPIHATVDLHVMVTTSEEGIAFGWTYCKDLFSDETMEAMKKHFLHLITQILQAPNTPISLLPLLDKAEQQQLLEDYQIRQYDFEAKQSVIELFEQRVAQQPEALALTFKDTELSYAALNEKADQLAQYLLDRGLQSGCLVGLCLDRSLEMVIGMLGILKAGAAYLPIDPAYPPERIRLMLADSQLSHVLCDTSAKAMLEKMTEVEAIDLMRMDWPLMDRLQTPISIGGDDLAYVIYTSGSTGRPKGAMIGHRGLSNLCLNQIRGFGLAPGLKVLQFASLSFDASCSEIFTTLLSGGVLVIPDAATLLSTPKLGQLIREQQIDIATLPPSYQLAVEPELRVLKTLVSAGEALNRDLALRCQAQGIRVINAYGPTENTVCISLTDDPVKANGQVSIGKPLDGVSVLVLDAAQQLVPSRVEGELYVGGAQLAKGYLNRPELSAERFIPHPFKANQQLYRTGDRCSWLPSGELAFWNRVDDQIKIRGYRVELGEIEQVLLRHEAVDQCIVLCQKKDQTASLIAYIKSNKLTDLTLLEDYLQSQLPAYMIPQKWLAIEEIPLTPNGKVDKQGLLSLIDQTPEEEAFIAPQTEVEKTLARIWMDLLDVEQIGLQDNFFSLGGDSILSIQAVSRAHREGYSFQVADMFEYQTLGDLANAIQGQEQSIKAEQGVLDGWLSLAPIQEWFFESQHPKARHYNHALLLGLNKSIEASDLAQVIAQILRQHDALRMGFQQSGGKWKAYYGQPAEVFKTETLSTTNAGEQITAICQKYQHSLDHTQADLCRFVFIETPTAITENRLFIVVHHLAIDGVSWRILLEDLQEGLAQVQQNKVIDLGSKGSSYRQWQQALSDYANSPAAIEQIPYWQSVTAASLPLSKKESIPVKKKEAKTYSSASLSKALTQSLLTKSNQAYHTAINDLLLSALVQTICDWSGQDGLVIGMEGHGREAIDPQIDVSRTVGWFTNVYPLHLQLPSEKDTGSLIKSVKEQRRQVPNKGLAYAALRYLHPSAEVRAKLSDGHPWPLVFNYLGQLDNAIKRESDWLSAAPEAIGETIAPENNMANHLEINAFVSDGQLHFSWNYAIHYYTEATIIAMANQYLANLAYIINHCQYKEDQEHTPSDFGLEEKVSYSQLDAFFNAEDADSEDDFLIV